MENRRSRRLNVKGAEGGMPGGWHGLNCDEFRKSCRRVTKLLALLASALDTHARRRFQTCQRCSTNIGPSSYSEVQQHTLAQACTGTKKKTKQQALWRMQKIVLHIHVMKERGASKSKGEKLEKGNSSKGEHGEIKAALRSWSPVDLFESRWLSAGMRTNTDVGDTWWGLRCTRRFVNVHKHFSECTRRGCNKRMSFSP